MAAVVTATAGCGEAGGAATECRVGHTLAVHEPNMSHYTQPLSLYNCSVRWRRCTAHPASATRAWPPSWTSEAGLLPVMLPLTHLCHCAHMPAGCTPFTNLRSSCRPCSPAIALRTVDLPTGPLGRAVQVDSKLTCMSW